MGIADDNSGIAYAMIYIMFGLIAVGGVWINGGIIVDEFDLLTDDLEDGDIWGAKTVNAVEDLCKIWNLVLWLVVGCSFIYGLITALRREGNNGYYNE